VTDQQPTADGAGGPQGPPSGGVGIPSGLIDAVLHLVSTGPVPLGAYTLAEMVAVDAVVDFLDEPPSTTSLAEAVRSLAARQLLVANPDTERLQVRGDLGIALVFQQRARLVVDARATGTAPGQPWRTLLLPQAEGVTLEILIDALGVHQLSLRDTPAALDRLRERLPGGEPGPGAVDAQDVLRESTSSALVTVTRFSAEGTVETAEASTDVVLAEADERLHVFLRAPDDPERLVPQPLDADAVRELIATLATVERPPRGMAATTGAPTAEPPARSVRAAVQRRWQRLTGAGRL